MKSVTANGLECHFQCTAEACQASLAVIYSPPTLNPKQLALLTNLDNLRRRQQDILREDPGRKDVELTQPIDALFRLKRYTDDSLNPTHTKRQFPAHNKKFLGAFGSDCHDFLRELGFKYAVSFMCRHVALDIFANGHISRLMTALMFGSYPILALQQIHCAPTRIANSWKI